MKPMTLKELDALLAQDPAYLAAERELRPDLNLAYDVISFRVDAGWSQAELATRVGTDQANISRLESALANPTLKLLKRVARALGVELDVRLRRSEDVPGSDSMESFIKELPLTLVSDTVTAQHKATMNWQIPAEPVASYKVSTQTSSPC